MSQGKMAAVVVEVVELKVYTTQVQQVMEHLVKDLAVEMESTCMEYGLVAVAEVAQVAQDLTPQFLEIKMVLATAVQGCCVT
jgi:hypothetical protein